MKLDADMTPLSPESLGNATVFPPTEEMSQWLESGLKEVSEGKVAALLLAGGQGTRLGSSDPKGMFPLELPSGLSLFGIQAQRIRRVMALASERYGKAGVIPWYIMTSGATKQKTIDYFVANKYFGLNPTDVIFFEQYQIPSIGLDGKVSEPRRSTALCLPSQGSLPPSLSRSHSHSHSHIRATVPPSPRYSCCWRLRAALREIPTATVASTLRCASRAFLVTCRSAASSTSTCTAWITFWSRLPTPCLSAFASLSEPLQAPSWLESLPRTRPSVLSAR